MFKIGPYEIKSRVLLAPMAGITDKPYRKLCRFYGAGLTTSEMITSDVSLWKTKKSAHRLVTDEDDPLTSIQIAGSDPKLLAEAAIAAEDRGAQIIDINMGCPAKKVCKKLAGSALLDNEELVESILQRVVKAVKVPVTLKTRTGWSPLKKNGPTVAKIAEDSGVSAIAMHGRTRACKFNGAAEYDTATQLAKSLSIPVIVNGDIDSAYKAKKILKETGASAVMIGRASWGNPWIFQQINQELTDTKQQESSSEQIINTIEAHFNGLYDHYGELQGIRIARKHFLWYCQNFGLPKDIVSDFNQIETTELQLDLVRINFKEYINHEEKVA